MHLHFPWGRTMNHIAPFYHLLVEMGAAQRRSVKTMLDNLQVTKARPSCPSVRPTACVRLVFFLPGNSSARLLYS